MPARRASARDLAVLAALAAAFCALMAYVAPLGDFPLNDDFVYAQTARRLAATGRLRLSQWTLSAALPQVLLAAAVSRAVPPGNENLRLSMLAWGCVGVLLFSLLLRALGLGPARALAGALVLLADPLYLAMSTSFHTEVPCLVFSLAALWAFLEGYARGSAGRLAASSAFAVLAFLTRQPAALCVAGGALLLALEGRLTRAAFWALAGPLGAAVLGYLLWLHGFHGQTWAWTATRLDPAGAASPGRLNACVQTLAGLLAPLALAAAPALARLKAPGRREGALLALIAGAAVWGAARAGGMPLLENTLHRRGLGVLTLADPGAKFAGPWASAALWRCVDALCLASSLALARLFWAEADPGARRTARAILCFSLPPLLGLLVLGRVYDRYLLTALPGLAAAALVLLKGRRLSLPACFAGCLALAAVSAVGLRDYFAWNRARWEAGLYAVSRGLRPEQVANGFDWDGQFTLERNMARLLAQKRPQDIGRWDWMALNPVAVASSFSPQPPRRDFRPLARFGYRTPLSRRTQYVYLHGYAP